MARLPRTPNEIKNQIYHTLCRFGCARWKALLVYAEAIAMRCDYIPEDVRADNADGLANKALETLKAEGRITRTEYGDERIVVPAGTFEPSFTDLLAFDSFATLVYEIAKEDMMPELCEAERSEEFPFHFMFTSGRHGVLYRVIVYGQDALSRIAYYNGTYNAKKDRLFVTLLVVSDVYPWEEFKDLSIRGKTRIAYVTKGNRKNKTCRCILTDVIEEEMR